MGIIYYNNNMKRKKQGIDFNSKSSLKRHLRNYNRLLRRDDIEHEKKIEMEEMRGKINKALEKLDSNTNNNQNNNGNKTLSKALAKKYHKVRFLNVKKITREEKKLNRTLKETTPC